MTLVVAIDTLMIADLLPKGVLQTLGTKDLSKAGAMVMPMQESLIRVQKLCNSHIASSTAPVTSTKRQAFTLCPSLVYYQCTYLAHVNIQSKSPDDKRCIMRCTSCMPASMQHDAIQSALINQITVLLTACSEALCAATALRPGRWPDLLHQ